MHRHFFNILIIILSSVCSLYSYNDSLQLDELKPEDSLNLYLQSQYDEFRMAVNSLFIFYKKGKDKGYYLSQEEINNRLEVYKQAFPSIKIDIKSIKRELVIEKYLQETGEYSTDEHKIKKAYDDYLIASPLKESPKYETIAPILKSKTLFTNENVVWRCKQETEMQYLDRQQKRAEAAETWPVEKIKINLPKNECLAFLIQNDSCIVNVGEFNKALLFIKMRKSLLLSKARIKALKKFLTDKFLADQAHLHGVAEKEDIKAEMKRWQENKYLIEKLRTMGKPVMDQNELWETYKNYYDLLFGNYEKVTLDIIGSTDSSWIDSIFNKIIICKKKDLQKGTKFIDSIPWIQSNSENLPLILVLPTDTLNENEYTLPIKTPFGYFICRVAKLKKIKSVSFRKALNQCTYIATRNKYINLMDSLINEKAYNYYRKHQATYTSPDTMKIQAWLLPIENADIFNSKADSTKSFSADTLSFSSIITSSLSLPQDVGFELERKYRETKKKSDFIGPIIGIYGIWFFKIKSVKLGGIPIPFNRVKQDIIDSLISPYLEIDADTSDEEVKEIKLDVGLARAYRTYIFDEVNNLNNEDLQDLINQGEIDTSTFEQGLSNERKYEEAREVYKKQVYDKNKEAVQKWMNSIKIKEGIIK